MMIDLLLFPLFLCFIYGIGAGVLVIGQGKPDVYPLWFYFAAGLLAVGFTSLMVNFFSGAASPAFYVMVILLCVLGLRNIRRADFPEFIPLGIMLTPLASGMLPGSDAGLYHLPHQLWIREEKIVFGLANFHSRYGFSSFMEYIGAPLWVGDHFKLVSYAAAVFPLMLLLFLLQAARSAQVQTAAVGLLITASLIIYSHYFEFSYTSTDTPTGIMFALAFFYGLQLLWDDAPPGRTKLAVFFLCAAFCFMLKVSGALMFLWVMFVVATQLRARRMAWRDLMPSAIIPAVLVMVWLVRGVIISGCLLYPVAQSCIDVPWVATDKAIENSIGITNHARHPATDDMTAWFTVWWLPHYAVFILAVLAHSVAVAALYRYYFREKLPERPGIVVPALVFALMALAVWFIKAPTPRFGIGVFIILPITVALSLFGLRRIDEKTLRSWRDKIPDRMGAIGQFIERNGMKQAPGTILVMLLAVKFGVFGAPLRHIIKPFDMLAVPAAVDTRPDKHFGIRSGPDCECFLEKYCGPDDRPVMGEYDGYKYFEKP